MTDEGSTRDTGRPDDLDALLREVARGPDASRRLPPVFELGGTERFRVLRRLGAGGFGVVWLVRDLAIGMDVALKTIPPGRPEFVYRLKREFRALADLRHENLVAYYELFAQDDSCFFTMEYVPGCTFLEFVRPAGRLDDGRLRVALEQLVRGLGALHAAGKVHRDVKPSNVLVTESGRLVLLDFNVATDLAQSLGPTAELAGTPEYMSPEHALGEPLSAASDWYSVGVMLYEALTGRLPFRGSWAQLIDTKVHASELPSPASLHPGLDRELVEFCMALLSRDPARRPGEVRLGSLLGRTVVRREGPASEPPLFGRDAESARLRAALLRARDGTGVTVLVEGPSGIGKTTLVRSFLTWAERTQRAIVLRGRCYERERVPYQGIDSLVDDLCRFLNGAAAADAEALLPRHTSALARLFPALERVPAIAARQLRHAAAPDKQEVRRQAFVALRELLARTADRFPLVLHIDDLQWGDLDTAALLQELLRPPDAPALLLVASYRSEDLDRSPCLRTLARARLGDTARLELGPLPSGAAESLLRELLGDRQRDADVARLTVDSGGNPLFIHELARHADAGEGSGTTALDLDTALRARIERLPADARALLEVVAVAGHPTPEPVVREAAAPAGPPWQAWDVLRAGHLVRFSGAAAHRHVEPFHDRIREVTVAAMAWKTATRWHGALADALERAGGADPEVLARHHAGAARFDRARELALAAAAQSERALAFDRAARLIRWAIDLDPERTADRVSLLAAWAAALSNAGRGADAARAYLEAAEGADSALRFELRRGAAQQLFLSGRIDEGVALATEDLRAAGLAFPKTPLRALALLLLRRLYIRLRGLSFRARTEAEIPPARLALIDHLWSVDRGLSMVDVVRGADFGARYMILALRAGEPRRVAQAVAIEAGHAASVSPSSKRTRALVERLERLGDGLGVPSVRGHALLVKGIRAYCLGEWREAVSCCDASARTFSEECTGTVWEIWTMRSFAATSLFYLGEWNELRLRVEAQAAEARDRGNVYGLTVTYMPYGLVAPLAAGDVEEARAAAREVVSSWSLRGFHLQHFWFLLAETLLDLHAGDGFRAWTRLRERWPALARSMLLRIPSVRTPVVYLRGVCALAAIDAPGSSASERIAEAARSARLLERASGRFPTAPPLAMLLRAALAARQGHPREAADALRRAADDLEHRHMHAHAAAARWQRAFLLHEAPETPLLRDQVVVAPDAVARMLVAGFPAAS